MFARDLLGLLLEAKAATVVIFSITILSLNGRVEIPMSLVIILHVLVDVPEVEVVVGICVIVHDGLHVVLHCFVELTQMIMSKS